MPATALDDVDEAATAEFRRRYGARLRLGEVTVVVAAYNEAANITDVLERIPGSVCGLRVSALVVDDGSTDGTAEVARRSSYVCAAPVNRGQGAALRLGYHVARTHGARFIATTDADGQYDASELRHIVEPLVDDRADFVTGSRRLGLYTTDDVVRHAGVRVFATLMSILTKRRVTDTSNGFRAFRADVIDHLVLEQPQYQATELLIGVYYRGFRVLEVGTTMNQRASGSSKKGPNLVYGFRFGRVIIRTWLRELRRNRREGRRMSDPPPTATVAGQSGAARPPAQTAVNSDSA